MRYKDIRRHLKPYSLKASRTTTINHAFAALVAPFDEYDEATVKEAVELLGQNPDADLKCVYCDARAETWDHVHATVKDKKFSGHGHRLGNLLPCCKPCNSKKGNKNWRSYIRSLGSSVEEIDGKERVIDAYLLRYSVIDRLPVGLTEYERLEEIKDKILGLFEEADELAKSIRRGAVR